MAPEAADILRDVWVAWRRRDKARVLSFCADDIVSRMNVPREMNPAGGERHGKAAMADRLQSLLDQFDFITHHETIEALSRERARGHAYVQLQHTQTGQLVELAYTATITVRDGLIHEWNVVHNLKMFRAFMDLVAESAASRARGGR